MDLAQTLPVLLGIAWLLPLASFVLIVFFGPRLGPHGRYAGHVATAAILGAFLLSVVALGGWISQNPIGDTEHADAIASSDDTEAISADHDDSHSTRDKTEFSGEWYSLVAIGPL